MFIDPKSVKKVASFRLKRFHYSSTFKNNITQYGKNKTPRSCPKNKLYPWWITGFIDAEGSFTVNIRKSPRSNTGWYVEPKFTIGLHKRDRPILEQIKAFLGVGNIYSKGSNAVQLCVQSIDNLEAVISHFDKYSLITKKRVDYELWRRVIVLIKNKEHLTPEGLLKIVSIRSTINLGLSDELKAAFSDIVSLNIPSACSTSDSFDIDPHWLAGFASGEGCFFINIFENKTSKQGEAVSLIFQLTQHVRDDRLIKSFIDCFSCIV